MFLYFNSFENDHRHFFLVVTFQQFVIKIGGVAEDLPSTTVNTLPVDDPYNIIGLRNLTMVTRQKYLKYLAKFTHKVLTKSNFTSEWILRLAIPTRSNSSLARSNR